MYVGRSPYLPACFVAFQIVKAPMCHLDFCIFVFRHRAIHGIQAKHAALGRQNTFYAYND
jgi:hypothetical protein